MSQATEIIAIDGPVGAGKSSVAKRVAQAMGFRFLDTGAMYRAATWRALHHLIPLDAGDALAESTRAMDLDLKDTGSGFEVFVDGIDVTQAIRLPAVTRVIYKLDQNPRVREHLVALQQRFGEEQPTVAEGRDIGTVVFPHAKCKIYLDASPRCRAERRARQLEQSGITVDLEQLCEAIRERDEQAMKRAHSPLCRAEDAVLVDSTNLSFEEAVEAIVQLAREKL